ncbi:MAG: hypothetical protein WD733_05020 [Bryobacterales bacterium]
MAQKRTPVIVTVSDEGLDHIPELAAELGVKGLKVDRVMPVTGVIAGSISPIKMASLGRTKGVLSVEEEHSAGLPPSGSRVQ